MKKLFWFGVLSLVIGGALGMYVPALIVGAGAVSVAFAIVLISQWIGGTDD